MAFNERIHAYNEMEAIDDIVQNLILSPHRDVVELLQKKLTSHIKDVKKDLARRNKQNILNCKKINNSSN